MRERPSRIVVGMLLRVAGSPELVIEQRIGGPGVGLVHADDNTANREPFLLGLVSALFRWARESHCLGQLFDLDMLALEYLEQLDLAIRIGWVGWDHIGSGPFERRLFNGALALAVEILQEVV